MKPRRLMMMAAITCGMSFAFVLVVLTSSSANMSTTARSVSPSDAVVVSFNPGVDPNDSQIRIMPDQMQLRGDVVTRANCAHPTVCSWLEGTPPGSVILGVDPSSPYTNTWDGGSATAQLYIGGIAQPTVGALTISWPDRDGKGIHSPLRGQVAAISFDGHVIWDMRTEHQSTFGDYYAAQHEPIRLTFVVTQSKTHTLVITVPPRTAWDISQVTINLSSMPTLIRGMAYSPYRDCQTPHWGTRVPSITEISEDMPRLFHSANAIRTYSSLYPLSEIPRLAHQWGLRVSPGAWLAREVDRQGNPLPNRNADEIAGLISIANTVPVESVIVGNEVLLRGDLTVSEMTTYIGEVRDRIPSNVQITTAETDNVWMAEAYPRTQIDALVNSVDYITVHIYPYWAGLSIDGAADRVIARVREIQSRYPYKRVVIGETGWPSAGQTNGSAVPTLENQYRFYREFLIAAEAANIEYYYFDPFDELWKRWPDRQHGGEGEAGAHWGVGFSDRTSKYPMWGVLLNRTALYPSRLYLPMTLRGTATNNGIGGANVRELPVWSVKPAVDMMARWESAAALSASGAKVIGNAPQLSDFQVYTEWSMPSNHFAPSGYMGDQADIDLYECERGDPHSGELSMRVTYSATGTSGWSGVYWQDPDGNWGALPGGYDLSGATRLSFWAKGQSGGEVIEFKAGGLWGPHGDSLQPAVSTSPLTLAIQWRQYSIDLRGQNLSQIIGGFAWVANRCSNPQGATFYLDDIAYEFDPTPPPIPTPTPTPNVSYSLDVYTDKDAPGNHYVPSGFMGDHQAVQLTECWTQNTHTGRTAISNSYVYGPTGSGPKNWAGVYWLHPADNWADRPGGYNLSGAQALTFWARGQDGGERVKFQIGGVVSGTSPYNDSVPTPVPIENTLILGRNWQQYTIPLPSSLDLGHVVGGFLWASDWMHNCETHPQGVTFYLDDIRYWYNLPVQPAPAPTPEPIRASFPFAIYSDGQRCGNHFVPSGYMGDIGDIDVLESYTGAAHSGTSSIRVRYDAQGQGPATCGYQSPCRWSGVYWQEPADNWAGLPGGYDLTGASRLVFWARGDQGGEKVRFFTGGIGLCGDPYPDSLRPSLSTDVLTLSNQWQKYTIDLRGRDLGRIVGGFGWSASMDSNPRGATFYLDDMAFEADPTPIPTPTSTPRPAHAFFPVYTDFEAPGNHYFATGWMGATEDITLDEAYRSDVHSAETAIRVSYTNLHSPLWAGIYWQDPASNWADRPGGYDLRGAVRVSFWAKSLTPEAQITFLLGGIGYQSNTCTLAPGLACPQYVDSLCPVVTSTRTLTADWQRYEIAIPPGQDLSRVVGGFGWTAERAAIFLLDDIVWEYDN